MENPIAKYLDGLRKKAIKVVLLEVAGGTKLTAKEKDEIREKIASKFTPQVWVRENLKNRNLSTIKTFIPSLHDVNLFDFLSLSVGYKRTVKQAFDDGFPIVEKLLDGLSSEELRLYGENIKGLNSSIIPLYSFFEDEIEKARANGKRPIELVVDRIDFLSQKAKEGTKISHASKFTNPDVKFPRIYAKADRRNDGYLRTGNARIDYDMHINAASLPVYKFLSLKINDLIILDLFERGDLTPIEEIFGVDRELSQKWAAHFGLCLVSCQNATNRLLKQVYFPVEDFYHQLSVLFPSSLVFAVKKKIDQMNSLSIDAFNGKQKKKKGEFCQKPYSSIYDLTLQRYGGDHPKNISALNNTHQNVYLLRSIPPDLSPRRVQPPRLNFFTDSLWPKLFQDDFQDLHKQLALDANTIHVRKRRDYLIRSIIYQVVDRLWLVRTIEPDWSESDTYQNLSQHQKIWLDQVYEKTRHDDLAWFNKVEQELARWFVNIYKKIIGDKALSLGDDQLPHIRKIISECEGGLQ